MHTAELAEFLGRAGYDVRHVFARFAPWGIGRVADPLPVHERGAGVRRRELERRRDPGAIPPGGRCVRTRTTSIITDAWNMKPLLAEAVRGYPYFLLFQGQENLCPLNNLRLLAEGPDHVEQCPRHQLATPESATAAWPSAGTTPGRCTRPSGRWPGSARRNTTRSSAGRSRRPRPCWSLNPLTEAMLQPFARRVRVVPWGMDPARFPWPPPDRARRDQSGERPRPRSWRRWPGSSSRASTSRHEACRLLAQRARTSSWSSRSTRRGRGGSMNSRGRSAGARRRNCPATTAPPTSAWCRRSPRTA